MTAHNHLQNFINMLRRKVQEDTTIKKKAVQVRFEEGVACTDGKTVTLPTDISTKVADEAMALAAHEMYGHGGFTNFSKYEKACKEEPYLQPFINALEDIRVDHKVMTRFPQYEYFYKRLLQKIKSKAESKGKNGSELAPEMRVLLEMIHRSYPIGAQPEKHSWVADEETIAWIEKHKDFVDDIIARCKDSKSTTDKIITAAQDLFKELVGDPPPQPPQPDNPRPNPDGDDGDDGDEPGDKPKPSGNGDDGDKGKDSSDSDDHCDCGCHGRN